MASSEPPPAPVPVPAPAAAPVAAPVQELIYPYIKLRKDFGRQPRFVEDDFRQNIDIKPNKNLRKRFRRIRFIEKSTQSCQQIAVSPMNTDRRIYVEAGLNHVEGGWPKDIDPDDPELVLRQRKKMEKEEAFQLSMPVMYKNMYKHVRENNAIELYDELFPAKWKSKDKQQSPKGVTVSVFRDWTKLKRPVHKVDWSPVSIGRMIVAHLPREFSPSLRSDPANCYIWEVENPTRPEAMIRSWGQVTDLHFHPKDYHSICGCCYDGTVQFWDTRVQSKVIANSPSAISHSKAAMSCSWITSKTNSELMSVGMDGQVLWWDIRNLGETLDQTWLDPEKGQCREEFALPGTVVEYEFSLPTKFLAGTFDGRIMIMMKKGKTPSDRLLISYKGHFGPILALKRNPVFIKNVLSVGDSTFRIFAEDCRESSAMWGAPKDEIYTHGSWLYSRPCVFGCTRIDGKVELYDLLRDPARAYYVMKVTKTMLTHFAPAPAPSPMAAVGTDQGDVYMQKLSPGLCIFDKRDKPKLAAVFEREAHKEKNIEQRHREIRLRKRDKEKKDNIQAQLEKDREEFKAKQIADAAASGGVPAYPDFSKNNKYDIAYEAVYSEQCKLEREFFKDLYTEMVEKGLNAWEEFKEEEEEEEEEEEIEHYDYQEEEPAHEEEAEQEGEGEVQAAAPPQPPSAPAQPTQPEAPPAPKEEVAAPPELPEEEDEEEVEVPTAVPEENAAIPPPPEETAPPPEADAAIPPPPEEEGGEEEDDE